MLIKVAAIGQRMPEWVSMAWQEYTQRFPRQVRLELAEIPLERRGKNADVTRLKAQEGIALMNSAPKRSLKIAMDIGGQSWSTLDLATRLENWLAGGRDVCLMIGGPDGLSPECVSAADIRWSLGPLTLPHPLVRVVLAEQLYRAWSIVNHHPYHRE